MGISVNVGSNNNDYSYLFQSLSSGSTNLNFLSDYASIKNGSYGKLMKAYYSTAKDSGAASGSSSTTRSSSKNILEKLEQEKKNPRVSKDVQTSNSNLTSGLTSLKSSISALQKDSTYTDTENGKSAADKVVSAVKAFVTDYNNVVNSAKGSTLAGKTAYVANMMSNTAASSDKLSEIGVRVNTNGTLEVDEAKLRTVDLSKVQDLFSSNDIMSYGSKLASRVQFAGTSAATSTTATNTTDNTEANKTKVSAAAGLKADGKALASDELYQKTEDKDGVQQYNVDKIFATAKSFVNNYNNMFDSAESSANSGVLANLSSIREKTAQNADVLKQFGINVDAKGKMNIDEDTFKKSDMSKVQEFFKDYGSSVATNASLVDYYKTTQANSSSGYTAAGAYNLQGGSSYTGIM